MDNENKQPEKLSSLPVVALWFDIAAVASFILGLGCFYSVVLMFVGLLLFLATVILPFVAIILAIGALCQGKKNIGTRGIIISLTAIIVPIIVVVVIVVMFSTGVAVIRWM